MNGKIVMVTGATAGIGKMTALELARKGAHVVLVARNSQKADDVVAWIKQETGNDNVEALIGDLSSIEQTRGVAEAFKAKYNRLDVLVNNAGVIMFSYSETVDGFETTFGLNHLVGYFYLTHLLLDQLKASAPARIVVVSSDAHYGGKINFDDLNLKDDYSSFKAYGQSKLMNVMFTYELARRLEGTGVTVNALHPGGVATNFGATNNNLNWFFRAVKRLTNPFLISEMDGAQTSIYLASSPEVEGITGQYFAKSKAKKSSGLSYDVDVQKRLWAVSEGLLGISEPVTE